MEDEKVEIGLAGSPDAGTVIKTTVDVSSEHARRLRMAMASYDPENRLYSVYLNSEGQADSLTQDNIATLGSDAQNNLDNIKSINRIIKQYINTNDLIGMVMQSLQNNINTEYKLSYKTVGEKKRQINKMQKTKVLIDSFNEDVDIEGFIADSILVSFMTGNYPSVLRHVGESYKIDYYPLNIAENSGYESNGNPITQVNMQNLKSALQKTMIKSRGGKPLFFKDTAEEVAANYPDEVVQAYKNNETYAILNPKYTGWVRVNNYKGRYGLSPIFRALSPALVLDDLQKADETNAKAKAKKIIHQKLRKETMGASYDKDYYPEMAYAHESLMRAWKNSTVVYTSPPTVESITYVEPSVADTPVENINVYRNKVLSSLGVAFLAADKSQTGTVAKLNLSQLMRCINRISESVEKVIKHFYLAVLDDNGIEPEYCPSIKIIDSEMLEMDVRMELSKLLYTTFNSSRETAFSMLGIDIEDEKVKREIENNDGLDEIFAPRQTSYTTSGNDAVKEDDGGRPADTNSNDPDKQQDDHDNRNEGLNTESTT